MSMGGLGSKKTDAMSMGLYANVYGFTANVSYGMFDNFDLAYPFCHQHVRREPIVSEYLFGYTVPVWSNFDKQHSYGYTLSFSLLYGWYDKNYSLVLKNPYELYPNHLVRKRSYGVIATMEFFNGVILNLKGTQWGGEIGVGYSFYSPFRKKPNKWIW